MRVSILSVKGGIGKSTLSLILGKYFAQNGKKALVIDRDPLGWASKIAGIKEMGILAQVVESRIVGGYYKEFSFKGRLGVFKIYGDGPRFYADAEKVIYNPSLREKFEEEYAKILKKGFDFYIVDNPSMVMWNDLEVQLELLAFEKVLPNEKILRIYLTDNTDSTIESTKRYMENIEKEARGRGNYFAIVVNLVPPFPEDIEKARERVRDFPGIKIVIPFIEELFMFDKTLNELPIPEEVKTLADHLLKYT